MCVRAWVYACSCIINEEMFIKYSRRQYAHSHWSIGVFRWEYSNTVVTSRFLCFLGTIWNHFKAGSLTLQYKYLGIQMENTFPSFDLGIDHLLPSDPWKESKRKKNISALHVSMCVSYWADLVEGAQAKTTKYYATKYTVNVFQGSFCLKLLQ